MNARLDRLVVGHTLGCLTNTRCYKMNARLDRLVVDHTLRCLKNTSYKMTARMDRLAAVTPLNV